MRQTWGQRRPPLITICHEPEEGFRNGTILMHNDAPRRKSPEKLAIHVMDIPAAKAAHLVSSRHGVDQTIVYVGHLYPLLIFDLILGL